MRKHGGRDQLYALLFVLLTCSLFFENDTPSEWLHKFELLFDLSLFSLSPSLLGFMLNEFIRYFEPVIYDRGVLTTTLEDRRRKRDAAETPPQILRLDIISQHR